MQPINFDKLSEIKREPKSVSNVPTRVKTIRGVNVNTSRNNVVTMGQWIIIMVVFIIIQFITFIIHPIVAIIVPFLLLIFSAVADINKNIQNLARAILIVYGCILLFAIVAVLFGMTSSFLFL